MVIHGQLPSLEIGNAYPVERTDGTTNSSIGSESRKFEDMWAERFNGSLEGYISYNSLAQRNENAMRQILQAINAKPPRFAEQRERENAAIRLVFGGKCRSRISTPSIP